MKSKRFTLSEEALKMLEDFKKAGSFRSLSQTVEEIIRRLSYVQKYGTLEATNIQLKRLGISVKKYPKGNCIAIHPKGKDEFKAFLGHDCEGWHLIAHAGSRFIQVLPPGMMVPITITTQIEGIEGMASYEDDWLTNPIKIRLKDDAYYRGKTHD